MSDTETLERDARGRWVPGNPGGPGRPARAVEVSYLRAFGDELTLDDWREIVRRAIADARAGDAAARQWVSRYALGASPPALADVAVREALGVSDELETRALAEIETTPALTSWGKSSPLERAAEILAAERQAAEQERQAEERRRKRAERQARQVAEDAGA